MKTSVHSDTRRRGAGSFFDKKAALTLLVFFQTLIVAGALGACGFPPRGSLLIIVIPAFVISLCIVVVDLAKRRAHNLIVISVLISVLYAAFDPTGDFLLTGHPQQILIFCLLTLGSWLGATIWIRLGRPVLGNVILCLWLVQWWLLIANVFHGRGLHGMGVLGEWRV